MGRHDGTPARATVLVALGGAILAGLVVALVLGLRGGGSSGDSADARRARTGVTSTTVTSTTLPPTTTTVDPGTLPQTDAEPTATSARFVAGVQLLWDAIVTDRPEEALAFFFPEAAYLQVKAISDPAHDYETRLIANFEADVHAYHARLGAAAATAHLDGVDVPDQAVWVLPGAEYNKGSYWRVYGTALRWSATGTSGTLPVTSMISWRGEWYVVHLGAIR